jgi:hypothetical protein
MSDLLEEIFCRATAFETGGRHIDYIKLDMTTRQVEVKLTAVPGGEYYDTILAQQQDTIQQARQDHAIWTKRHGGGVTEEDLTERVGLMLKSLLDSKFLREDYYEMPKSKRAKAKEELEQLGLEVDCMSEIQILRYALLRDMVDLRMGRFEFDNKDTIGNYMYENRDTYSPARYGHYFRFETTLALIYQDLDQLKKANRDRKLEECITSMLTDMEPLCEHVVPNFSENYNELLDGILMVGDLQKKLKLVSPNTFKGGYNQKLTCNLVGLLCGEGVYDVNPKQADVLIYTGKTHYTYINNYANYDSSDSELSREEVRTIKELIKKHI